MEIPKAGQPVYRNADGELGVIEAIKQGVLKVYYIKMDNGEVEKHLACALVRDFSFLPDYDTLLKVHERKLPAHLAFYLGKNLDIDWKKVSNG